MVKNDSSKMPILFTLAGLASAIVAGGHLSFYNNDPTIFNHYVKINEYIEGLYFQGGGFIFSFFIVIALFLFFREYIKSYKNLIIFIPLSTLAYICTAWLAAFGVFGSGIIGAFLVGSLGAGLMSYGYSLIVYINKKNILYLTILGGLLTALHIILINIIDININFSLNLIWYKLNFHWVTISKNNSSYFTIGMWSGVHIIWNTGIALALGLFSKKPDYITKIQQK